jgi:hypothetical protein
VLPLLGEPDLDYELGVGNYGYYSSTEEEEKEEKESSSKGA